ncbi:hypothetical protein CVT25_004957 [Psilocybe cyanescens]|uniref:Uncharacterized protein n=1 Tax=Psilocybe cyanescens TaxID=93625 RepID=A0A409XU95_PSICY|nr:hypothetical protein CVT25_004957 [Psilocybe cyanescens]
MPYTINVLQKAFAALFFRKIDVVDGVMSYCYLPIIPFLALSAAGTYWNLDAEYSQAFTPLLRAWPAAEKETAALDSFPNQATNIKGSLAIFNVGPEDYLVSMGEG